MVVGSQPIVFHFRSLQHPHEQDGVTVVYNPTNKSFGVAVCRRMDHYCRSFGKNEALKKSESAPEITLKDIPTFSAVRLFAIGIADIYARRYKKRLYIRELNNEFRLGA